jgi:hypothetical protein
MDEELQGNRKRTGVRKYRYDRRTRAAALVDRRTQMVSYESIAEVFTELCCDMECIRKFPPSTIRMLRTEMHMQSFHVKSSKNLDVHRAFHKEVGRGKKLVTVEGIDICLHAWRILHSIPLRTFQRYKARAKFGVRGAPHGNLKRTKLRSATVQGIETLRSLLEAAADHMPHLSRTLRTGEKVGLKVLPAGTKWKQFLASVNEVRLGHALGITHGFQLSMKDSSRPTWY